MSEDDEFISKTSRFRSAGFFLVSSSDSLEENFCILLEIQLTKAARMRICRVVVLDEKLVLIRKKTEMGEAREGSLILETLIRRQKVVVVILSLERFDYLKLVDGNILNNYNIT